MLPRPVLSRLSPATDTLLQTYSLPYAAAVTSGDAPERWARHALSLRPEATGRSLALLTAFTLLMAGLSSTSERAWRGAGGPAKMSTGCLATVFQEVVEFSLQMPGNAVLFVILAAIAMHHPPARRPQAASP